MELFNRIAIMTFENAITREIGTLRRMQVARQSVAEKSTIISMRLVLLRYCMYSQFRSKFKWITKEEKS